MIEIVCSVITGIATIVVVLINGSNTRNALMNELKQNQVVTDTKLGSLQEEVKELKEDVKKHNSYGLQIQELKTKIDILEKRIG